MSEHLKFKVSSELKNVIGKELITDDFIAIFELVKNSYDARSKKVEIIFFNTNNPKETKIYVYDNGDGMSYDDLQNKWLFVAYSEKKLQKEINENQDYRDKIHGKRIYAGAKGIGRFSCDKLGSNLFLYTKKENERNIHVLHMDWDKFEKNPTKQFQTIDVPYHSCTRLDLDIKTTDFSKGTILEISSLRSSWDRPRLLQLKRHLQRLINPGQMSKNQEFKIYLRVDEYAQSDERYRAKSEEYNVINGLIDNVLFERLEIKTTQISSSINEMGNKITTELNDKDEFVYKVEEKNEYQPLKNIQIKLFYMNQAAKTTFSREMGIPVVRYGSVFFYKNGIKINPYGNEGNDWLGLDRRKTQGMRRNLGNRDVMGRIEVSGDQLGFVEASSRDGGVIRTPDIELLEKFFMEKALRRLEKYVVEGINWDSENKPKSLEDAKVDAFKIVSELADKTNDETTKIEFNENLLETYAEKQLERTPELIKNIEAIRDTVTAQEDRAYIDLQVKSVKNAFRSLVDRQKELELELERREKDALFITKKTGEEKQELISLQHQIGIWTDRIKDYLLDLARKMEKKEPISNAELIKLIDNIMMKIKMMKTITSFVTKANFNFDTQIIEQDLVLFIDQYIHNVFIPLSEESGSDAAILDIAVAKNPDAKFVMPFNPYEIIIVIDNLIDNSVKAHARRVWVNMTVLNEKELEIRFIDDGNGIMDSNLPRLFEFGFSTIGGAGIGLYHVNSIMKNYGTIRVNNQLQKGVEFILKVVR
jgi:signal transduction histidine kinase